MDGSWQKAIRRQVPPFSSKSTLWAGPMTDNWHEVINMSDCDKAILAPLLGDRAFRYHPPVFRSTSRPVSAAMHALLPRVCLMALLVPAVFAVLPSYIKPCKKRDPDINECITRSIDQLRDKLSAGIPEFEAPPIEPLYLKQIRLSRGPVGARLDVNLTDLQVSGPSTFKVRDLKADVENVVFTFKVNFEKLYFQGKYQIDARVLLLKLTGEGNITGTFTDYDSDVVLRAYKVYRDNDIYLNFERMKVKIRIGKAHLHLSNLFGGDTVLSAATHDLLNNNNALFLDEITPVLETSLADLFTNVANKITKSFTYKELFPDD